MKYNFSKRRRRRLISMFGTNVNIIMFYKFCEYANYVLIVEI